MKNIIKQYEIIEHGEFVSKDFPGCELLDWKIVCTGIGKTKKDALGDAYAVLDEQGWDVENSKELRDKYEKMDTKEASKDKFYVISIQAR